MKKIIYTDIIEPATPGCSVQIKNGDVQSFVIAYTTNIPFDKSLTIISGKTLETNDVFTIAGNPVEGGGFMMELVGDGDSHEPVLTAFDDVAGTFDSTALVRNLIIGIYLGGRTKISIKNDWEWIL